MKRFFQWVYLIGLHILLALILWKSDFLQKVGYRLGFITPWPHHQKMMTYHQQMDSVVPDESVIFIGDSIIQSLPVSAVVPNGVNYGIGGDTTVTVLKRIPEYKSLDRAEAVVLLIGINDLRWRSNPEILETFGILLQKIPEGPKVFIVSILPVNPTRRAIVAENATLRIEQLNREFRLRTTNRKNAVFIDVHDQLADAEGFLASKYDNGDGLHLSPIGYQVFIDGIRLALYENSFATGQDTHRE